MGNVVGLAKGNMPPVLDEIKLETKMLDKIAGDITNVKLSKGEHLILTVGTSVTIGEITHTKPLTVKLKKPVCAQNGWTAAISKKVNNRWRLVGYGKIL